MNARGVVTRTKSKDCPPSGAKHWRAPLRAPTTQQVQGAMQQPYVTYSPVASRSGLNRDAAPSPHSHERMMENAANAFGNRAALSRESFDIMRQNDLKTQIGVDKFLVGVHKRSTASINFTTSGTKDGSTVVPSDQASPLDADGSPADDQFEQLDEEMPLQLQHSGLLLPTKGTSNSDPNMLMSASRTRSGGFNQAGRGPTERSRQTNMAEVFEKFSPIAKQHSPTRVKSYNTGAVFKPAHNYVHSNSKNFDRGLANAPASPVLMDRDLKSMGSSSTSNNIAGMGKTNSSESAPDSDIKKMQSFDHHNSATHLVRLLDDSNGKGRRFGRSPTGMSSDFNGGEGVARNGATDIQRSSYLRAISPGAAWLAKNGRWYEKGDRMANLNLSPRRSKDLSTLRQFSPTRIQENAAMSRMGSKPNIYSPLGIRKAQEAVDYANKRADAKRRAAESKHLQKGFGHTAHSTREVKIFSFQPDARDEHEYVKQQNLRRITSRSPESFIDELQRTKHYPETYPLMRFLHPTKSSKNLEETNKQENEQRLEASKSGYGNKARSFGRSYGLPSWR